MNKHFLTLKDFSKAELQEFLTLAKDLKAKRTTHGQPLLDKSVVMMFSKPSNRTRISFEIGAKELGASTVYLGDKEISLGERESLEDVAEVVSRYAHMLVVRTFAHEDLLTLAKHASIPVINALTDACHPCQTLADILTIMEHKKKALEDLKIVYVGDGNNMLHSWLYGVAVMGLNFVYSTPQDYQPQRTIVEEAQRMAQHSGAQIVYVEDPQEAVSSGDIVYTDVWASMGQEDEVEKRSKIFLPYQVNEALLKNAKDDVSLMHCLPAHRGLEVNETVLNGPHSIIFDQAENRLHAQKAIMQMLSAI
jgi:ornithine carbamoyltransferase